MGKITIDSNSCVGCGLCVNVCPDCFAMGDDGIAKVIAEASTNCDINEAASQCPVNCITVA